MNKITDLNKHKEKIEDSKPICDRCKEKMPIVDKCTVIGIYVTYKGCLEKESFKLCPYCFKFKMLKY